MNFAQPWALMALWTLPLAAICLWWAYRRRLSRMRRFASQDFVRLTGWRLSRRRSLLKGLLFCAAIAAIAIALARPRWGFRWQELAHGGVDIMVVLDVSRSMLAQDIEPSRLERAKRELIDLVGMLEGDRVGVVAFAGVPFVQCPLTVDYRMTRLFINQLDIDLVPVQGSDLGAAIGLARESLLRGAEGDSEAKAMILITDGEDLDGRGADAAREAAEAGIKIFAIGVGSQEGAPIPLPDGGFKKDGAGNVVVSKLAEASLAALAEASGGTYMRSTSGDLDLEEIYHRGIRGGRAAASYGESRQRIWFERFQFFVLAAFLLLWLEGLVRDVRRERPRRGKEASS